MPDTRRTLQEQLQQLTRQGQNGSGEVKRPVALATPAAPTAATPHPKPSSPTAPLHTVRGTPPRSPEASAQEGRPQQAQAVPTPVAAPPAVGTTADKPSSPDLEALVALDTELKKEDERLKDRAEALEWDRLGHTITVEAWERERATQSDRLSALEKKRGSQERRLATRENNLAARKAEVDSEALANRAEAKRLKERAITQAAAAKQLSASKTKLDAREKKVGARETKVAAAETRHRARRAALVAAEKRATDLEAQLSAAHSSRNRLQRELNQALAATLSALNMPSWEVASWMLRGLEIDLDDFAPKVAFPGDGPFESADLESSARSLGLRVGKCGARQPAGILIVGRQDWQRDDIERHLEALQDAELFIFPQELWVAALLIRHNPFRDLEDDATRSALEAFGEGHPVIEWLRGMQFPWPEWSADEDPPPSDLEQRVKASPLVKLEYRTGKDRGLPAITRRQILNDAFISSQLPLADFVEGVRPAKQREYMDSWGGPRSRTRLRRIAWHLAMLVSIHAKLRNHEVAVADWEADLAWLKKQHYSRFMRFQWP